MRNQKQWKLIRFRKELGLNQDNMAKLLGISVTSYAQKENGNSDFKLSEVFELKKILRKDIEEIFF